MTAKDERAAVLFDLLADGDRTSSAIREATGWKRTVFFKAVQGLRDILAAEGDVISVVAEPQGTGEPWVYRLAHGNQITNPEQSRWITNRFGDAERRLKTVNGVLSAAVAALDGRTVEGRKARIYHLHLSRAEEEVGLISEGNE